MRAVTAVLSRILLHLFPQSIELAMVAAIIGARAGVDLAVVAVATVVVYVGFTIAAVNTRTKYLELMNVAGECEPLLSATHVRERASQTVR